MLMTCGRFLKHLGGCLQRGEAVGGEASDESAEQKLQQTLTAVTSVLLGSKKKPFFALENYQSALFC